MCGRVCVLVNIIKTFRKEINNRAAVKRHILLQNTLCVCARVRARTSTQTQTIYMSKHI